MYQMSRNMALKGLYYDFHLQASKIQLNSSYMHSFPAAEGKCESKAGRPTFKSKVKE